MIGVDVWDRDHISGNSSFSMFYMSPAEAENYAFGTQQTVSDVKYRMILNGRGLLITSINEAYPTVRKWWDHEVK